MSDEDALLAAIAAYPDEDTPRLAYADWLDEHDRPIRAEFIRLQIEIAHKETLPRVLQNRYVDLWKRNQELIDDHRDELLGPLTALPKDTRIEFRRGFVSEVELSVGGFLKHAALLAVAMPLPAVSVVYVADRFGDFVRCPFLGCVTHISGYASTLEENPPGWPDDVDMLDASDRLTRLESLDLEGCGIDDLHCDLAYNYSFLSLTSLDLSNNQITDRGVSNLLRTDLPPQLKRLILGDNPISDEGAIALAQRWPTGDADKLKELNLKRTNIGPPGQQALLARFGGRIELF